MVNYQIAKLKDVIKIMPSGISHFAGEKKYVDTSSVENTKILNYEPITFDNRRSRANMQVNEGCVLFAKAKDTHKVLLITSENCNNIYSTGFFVLKTKTEKILPEYLYYYFNFNEIEKLKNRLAQGATQIAINNDILYNSLFESPLF